MRIIRRGVRVDDGGYYERQEFKCRICSHIVERKVATDGTVRETTLAARMQESESPGPSSDAA
jgi:hypothetical protein